MTPDFIVTDQVSVWLFEPLSEAAFKFVRDNMDLEECPCCGQSFAVDYRNGGLLADDLECEGFSLMTRH